MVFSPQAWPFLRSASVQTTGGQSGASTSRAPALVDLDAIAAGFVDIQEECLLDGMFVRARFDVHAALEEDVGRPKHLLSGIDRVGQMVKAAARAVMIAVNARS